MNSERPSVADIVEVLRYYDGILAVGNEASRLSEGHRKYVESLVAERKVWHDALVAISKQLPKANEA